MSRGESNKDLWTRKNGHSAEYLRTRNHADESRAIVPKRFEAVNTTMHEIEFNYRDLLSPEVRARLEASEAK